MATPLALHSGEWLSVIGHNGSGKSTLIKTIAGLRHIAEPAVDRRWFETQLVPYVQQATNAFFGATPWEELFFLLETAGVDPVLIPDRAIAALVQVGMLDAAHADLETLSGGQRQLISLAGCLAIEAPLLLFDEATSMLDEGARRQVLDVVRRLHAEGRTVVWVTHQMDEAALGDRIIVMENGFITYDGSPVHFFYGDHMQQIPCLQYGFAAPFAVQVGWEMLRLGATFATYPLTVEMILNKRVKTNHVR